MTPGGRRRHAAPAGTTRHPRPGPVTAGLGGPDGGAGTRASAADRGTVTAELALGLPAVVGVLLLVLVLSTVATAQLRCADGARAGARAAALGEDTAVVSATAAHLAGPGATVAVRRDGSWVTVTVGRRLTAAGGAGPWAVRAEASARVEP